MVTRVTSESRPEESGLRLPRTLAQKNYVLSFLPFPNYVLRRIYGGRQRREKPRFLPQRVVERAPSRLPAARQAGKRRRANIRAESLRLNYPLRSSPMRD